MQDGLLMWLAWQVGSGQPLGAPPEVIAGIFFLNLKSRFFFLVQPRPFSGFAVKIICASVYRKGNDRSLVEK